MKRGKCGLALLLAATLCIGSACAQTYVPISELRAQAQEEQELGEILIPEVEETPVLAIQRIQQAWNEDTGATVRVEDNGLRATVGTFDESVSGRFLEAVRQGKHPSHTELNNGLTLEEAQRLLDAELQALVNQTLSDYGLIWTEIATWENQETWLFNYGRKYHGLTLFSDGLTFDARGENSYLLIVPSAAEERVVYEDVPLAGLREIKASVEGFLNQHKIKEIQGIELGYLPCEAQGETLLAPVWRLDFIAGEGYESRYFSAQTGALLDFDSTSGLYDLPDILTWDAVR